MTKALGAAAIVFACLLAACARMREKRERIARLLSLRDSLLFLRRELSERRRGMRELFFELARREETEPTGMFYRRLGEEMRRLGESSFSEIWASALRSELAEWGETVTDTLRPLGNCLGGSEAERQCTELARAAEELDRQSRGEREALVRERKLSYGLSLSAGALIVIMLL